MNKPRLRGRVLGSVSIILIGFACLEFLGYQLLQLQLRNHPYLFEFSIEKHIAGVGDQQILAWASGNAVYGADPELGWKRMPNRQSTAPDGWTMSSDALGARLIPEQVGPVWLSTYGDSFTECVEVNDDQTWQAYLVAERGGQVRNYGVSGFGPDQALLYLEQNLAAGLVTPIVFLAMIEENLDRGLNTFRPFYTWPDVDFSLGLKPRFVPQAGGKFVLHNSKPDSWDRPSITAAIHAAAEFDSFYQRRVERIAFPYAWAAAELIQRQGLILTEWLPRKSELAADTLVYLLERFVVLSQQHQFTPVLVLLPSSGRQIGQVRGGYQDAVSQIIAARAPANLFYIDVVKALAGPDAQSYLQGLSLDHYTQVSHASPAANAAIARALDKALDRLEGQ